MQEFREHPRGHGGSHAASDTETYGLRIFFLSSLMICNIP